MLFRFAGVSYPPKVEALLLCHRGGCWMARKRYLDEDCLKILRQVELDLAGGAGSKRARHR